MALIDRYVHAIRTRLPRKDRDDIAAELREVLQSQIEAEEAERGRPLAEEEVAAILKRFGSPERVAARYGAREHLIGPAVFPHYRLAVKIELWILIPPLLLWAVGTALLSSHPVAETARALWISLLIVFGNLAIVTLVFARIERIQDQLDWAGRWDPRWLPAEPTLRPWIPRRETVVSLLTMMLWLLWWTDVLPINRWLWSGRIPVAPAPIWDALTPIILSLMVASIAIDLAAIARPRWVTIYEGAGLLLENGILFMLGLALRAPRLVVVTNPNAPGGPLEMLLNWVVYFGLLVWAIAVLGNIGFTLWRWMAVLRTRRSYRRRGMHSAMNPGPWAGQSPGR
jgi:hypothetical protein